MTSTFKIFKSIGLSAFIGSSLLITVPHNSKADHETGHFPVCPGSSSDLSSLVGNGGSNSWGACYMTPSKYEITLYEMGFCTADPMTGANLEKTDCVSTVNITSGQVMDLAPGNKATLPSSKTRPPAGTYPYMYIVVNNTFKLAGSYTSNDGNTYYSTPNANGDLVGDSVTTGPATEFTDDVTSFSGGGCDSQYDRTVTGKGVIKAYLADTSQQTTSTDDGSGNCSNAARIVGSFKPTNPVVITKSTNGLDVSFTVTDSGMQIETGPQAGRTNDSGTSCQNQPCIFYTGDFQPVFTTF